MKGIKSNRVVLPSSPQPQKAIILISDDGKIQDVITSDFNITLPENVNIRDYGNLIIMPGLVDTHVHLNDPGRTDWEGFDTGTRAAASGGVTTLVDMPLNSIPPTTTVKGLREKVDIAKGQIHVDVAFWGGLIPNNSDDLIDLMDAGVRGFKCFLINSGVDEFPAVSSEQVNNAAKILTLQKDKLKNSTVLMFHAEMETFEEDKSKSLMDLTYYSRFLSSRPTIYEEKAVSLVTEIQNSYPDLRTHIVHLSAGSCLPILQETKMIRKLPITIETCFHYLYFTSQGIPRGATQFKCCPPIREDSNRLTLLKALEEDLVDFVVSDHSPCIPELKRIKTMNGDGNFDLAWGGISSLGLGLSILHTLFRDCSSPTSKLGRLVQWLSERPAKHANLHMFKGAIKIGYDADFVIWDPDKRFCVEESNIHFKHKVSPYIGETLYGVVHETILRGEIIYSKTSPEMFRKVPLGKVIL